LDILKILSDALSNIRSLINGQVLEDMLYLGAGEFGLVVGRGFFFIVSFAPSITDSCGGGGSLGGLGMLG
jgi:hypothetical protein